MTASRLGKRASRPLTLAGAILAAFIASGGNPAISAAPVVSSPADRWAYADIADLFLESPVVANVRINDAIPIRDATAGVARAGTVRHYLTGNVLGVIRGTGGVAPQVSWVADIALDARGKLPKLRKTQVILAALPVAGRPAEVRLAARDAMVPWSSGTEARVRRIVAEGLATGAPPRVTGIASAFHSAGNLPGEGESQIFLATRESQPVSISVLSRPGLAKRWSVALDEIVDEAAAIPAKDSLLWYRLACVLPPALPPAATAELAEIDASAARADYAFVMGELGPCSRTRSQK